MGTTPNLGLPVYGSSDTPDWMDTNNGFEELDNIVGGAAGVQLDFANPLHVFTQSNNTYTATQTCWLFGSFMAADSNYAYVTIDGTRVAGTYDAAVGYPSAFVPPIRIESGSVIEVTNLGPDTYPGRQCLAVYSGEIVSDTFVWNEAIVELDYTNPLWVYDATSPSSYTATKRCYLIANLITTTANTQSSVKVNGTKVIVANGNQNDGGSCYLPLEKGDIVTVENITNNLWGNIVVLDGTIKGSAPGNSGGGDLLELLDFDNAVAISTTNITASKAGAIIINGYNTSTNVAIYINDVDYGYIYGSANTGNVFLSGIPKGTRIKLSQATANAKAYFVPYKYESIAPEITVYNEAEVELDYANPLHTFTRGESSEQTYTATQTCYLVGNWAPKGTSITDLYINNTPIYSSLINANDCISPNVFLKLSAGDVVKVPNLRDYAVLQVLKGTVSGSVGNLTGAWIPNYSDHIASLTYNGGTYTATEDCIVEIGASPNTNTAAKLYVNGYVIATSYASTSFYGFNRTVMLHKNDVLTWENCSNGTFYGEVFGLV